MTLKKNIEYIMKLKGMTQSDLAECLHIAQPSAARLIKSEGISLKNICKIARALDVTPADLFATPSAIKKTLKEGPTIEFVEKHPTHATVTCPSCGNKLKLTLEEL